MKESNPYHLLSMNIELTTACPLRCPQCYCTLEGGKHIPLQTALFYIQQAKEMGVKHIELSGGETMCYPYLYDVIKAAKENEITTNVALSGYHFTQNVYEKLLSAGVGGIFISLNGSTEKINSMTRDGYDLAISALELLQRNKHPDTTLNWVMHSNNSDDFSNMVALAERYDVSNLVIIGVKPDSRHMLSTLPSFEQMKLVGNYIRTYRGKVRLIVESCFSPMLALTSETKLFGNMNIGAHKGCGAGRYMLSISVDGLISPCRHLDYYEKSNSLKEYWNNSLIQKKIRSLENQKREPCVSCKFCNYCRHCLAINSKLNGDLYIGNWYCPLANQCKI